tara:strand:+ start:1399 stop:2091 length:693 start_codon:yes stop_codon:yes gene_type:complete
MSRISSRSFAVNSSQQQIVELGSIGEVEIDVVQSDRTLLNCNASLQLAGSDISDTNPLYVINTDAANMETNSNLRIAAADVDDTNRVPCQSNLQVLGVDVDDTDRLPVKSTLQIGGVDVSGANKVPVTLTGGVSGTEANLDNAFSVISGDTSVIVNVNSDKHNIFGNSTDSTNAINVQISADNSNWYSMGIDIFPDSGDGDFQLSLDMPIQYIRLKYNGTATVTATVISA